MKQTKQRGGARPGAGRASAELAGIEKRKQYPLSIPPSVYEAFHKLHGRGWSRRIEELMRNEITQDR